MSGGPASAGTSTRIRTRQVRLPSGSRFPLLLSSDGVPDVLAASYVLDTTPADGCSVNTLNNRTRALGAGRAFYEARGVTDLSEHLRAGYPKKPELEALAKHLEGDGPRALTSASGYFGEMALYLAWVARRVQADVGEDVEARRLEAFQRTVRLCKPAVASTIAPRLGLTEDQRRLFLEVIVPGHPSNPFGSVSFRNLVMMSATFHLGMRAGEVLGLKVQDLDLNGHAHLKIVVRRDDPEDPRSEPAMQKTLARDLPMQTELADLFRALLKDRRRWSAARRHGYVFTNVDGAPLGGRGLRKTYQTLRTACPELGSLISHMLRHDWNDRWNELVEAKGWDPASSLRIQLDAMGWSPGSRMPGRYGVRSNQKLMNERLLEAQSETARRMGL